MPQATIFMITTTINLPCQVFSPPLIAVYCAEVTPGVCQEHLHHVPLVLLHCVHQRCAVKITKVLDVQGNPWVGEEKWYKTYIRKTKEYAVLNGG